MSVRPVPPPPSPKTIPAEPKFTAWSSPAIVSPERTKRHLAASRIVKHMGPGPHPNGTEQSVHGRRSGNTPVPPPAFEEGRRALSETLSGRPDPDLRERLDRANAWLAQGVLPGMAPPPAPAVPVLSDLGKGKVLIDHQPFSQWTPPQGANEEELAESRMKALFEGSIEIDGERYEIEVVSASGGKSRWHDSNEWSVKGVIKNPAGDTIGEFERNLKDRFGVVQNVSFEVYPEGKGIGSAALALWSSELASAGYESMELTAAYTGRYAWARLGYEGDISNSISSWFDSDHEFDEYGYLIRDGVGWLNEVDTYGEADMNQLADWFDDRVADGYMEVYPHDLAALGSTSPNHLGKRVLLSGPNWDGSYYLGGGGKIEKRDSSQLDTYRRVVHEWALRFPDLIEQDDPLFWESVKQALHSPVAKHMGPGPHPSGSDQSVHGRGHGPTDTTAHSAPILESSKGNTVNRTFHTDAEGNPAAVGMAHLPDDIQSKIVDLAARYGETPPSLEANYKTVLDSAAARYALLNSDRSWHDGTFSDTGTGTSDRESWGIPDWLKSPEYDDVRSQLVELSPSGDQWRYTLNAGDELRQIDRFYARHHEEIFSMSNEFGFEFGRAAAFEAAVSPGLRATENLRMTELAMRYGHANAPITQPQADLINARLAADRQILLDKYGDDPTGRQYWRVEKIAPELDFEVSAGDRYLDAIQNAGDHAKGRIFYTLTQANGEKLSLGRGYRNYAVGLNILHGDAPIDSLGGIKVRSFYNNIVNPYTDDITIDFQMINAGFDGYGDFEAGGAAGALTREIAYQGVSLGVRPLLADAARSAAAQVPEIEFASPGEFQEVIWHEWKRGTPTSGRGRSMRWGDGKWGTEEIVHVDQS